jgi:hypothetical protein
MINIGTWLLGPTTMVPLLTRTESCSFPEQSDIIMTNLLSQFGLTRDGQDAAGAQHMSNQQSDDEGYTQMRNAIKVSYHACAHPFL